DPDTTFVEVKWGNDRSFIKNAVALEAELIAILVNEGDGYIERDSLPPNVFLDLKLRHDHLVKFGGSRELGPTHTVILCDQVPTELLITWDPEPSTEYHLEWTYVDDYPLI